MTAGTRTSIYGKLATIKMLEVRKNGQGKDGHKKPVLFPKIVFLYDENLHGPGKPLEDVFEAGNRVFQKDHVSGLVKPDRRWLCSEHLQKIWQESSARWDVVHFFLHGMRGAA